MSNIVANESFTSFSYLSDDSIRDAKKILEDEYIFDIWHDFKKFGSTVCELPEIHPSLGSFMSDYQFLEFYESLTRTKHKDLLNRNHASAHSILATHQKIGNDQLLLSSELPISLKPEQFFSMVPFEINISNLCEFENDYLSIPIKQLKKDLERDRIIINGHRLVGATVEFDGIIQVVEEIIDRNLINCQLPLLSSQIKREIVLNTLRLATRTYSGGIAFKHFVIFLVKIFFLSF